MNLHLPFDESQQISSGLSLLFIIILSIGVGYMAIVASEDIIQGMRQSVLIHADEPMTEGVRHKR